MRVEYFKQKQKLTIEFASPGEEINYRMLNKTWAVQDDKLEEFIGLIDATLNKHLPLVQMAAEKLPLTDSEWKYVRYMKKKAKTIRWFIKKMFGFDIGKKDDIIVFADGIAGMVEVSKFIEYAFQKAHNPKRIIHPAEGRMVN